MLPKTMNVKRRVRDANSSSPMHGERRKKVCSEAKMKDLVGQLTARSHILHCTPATVVLEICTKESIKYITCDKLQHVLPLRIGQYYKFSRLIQTGLRLESEIVQCYRFSESSTWCEIEETFQTVESPFHADFTNIRGKVTQVNHDLGICYLNKFVMVITSACSRIALIPALKEGQVVTIFNVHRISLPSNVTVYVLCAKSYLSVEDSGNSEIPALNLSPLLVSLGDALRDFRVTLWLQECHILLQKSFSDDFLASVGIPLCEYDEFRSSLLQNVANIIFSKITVREKSILEEFISPNHSTHCGSLKKEMIPVSLLSLIEFFNENPGLDNVVEEDGSNMQWQYHVGKNSGKPLVGVIAVKNASHRLTLTDSFGSVACIILPKDAQVLKGKELAGLNNSVVLIWDYDVIREKFSLTKDGEKRSNHVRCIGVCTDNIHVMASFSKDWRSNKNDVSRNAQENSSVGISNKINEKKVSLSKYGCISPLKNSPLQDYRSQYVYVKHKSSTFAPMNGKSAKCYLLVTLLGEMVLVTSTSVHSVRDNSNKMTIFIALENMLLAAQPLIAVDSVYEIRFPISFDNNFFRKKSPLYCISGLSRQLPTTDCVTLPSSCEIYIVTNHCVSSDHLRFSDCYGIGQSLTQANTQELINVTGYIIGRFHQEPRFDREKVTVKAYGFGTPGSKVIALILSDTPPESQTGTPATIYLTYSATLQYPIALVPGAKVIFRFVNKVKSQEGSASSTFYFRTSILTSVELLDLFSSEKCDNDQEKMEIWGVRSLLPSILNEEKTGCKWISVSQAQLVRLSLSAMCLSCKHQFVNGTCSFVGCSAPSNPSIFSKACIKINDFACETLVFIPNDLVKKLFKSSEQIWERILMLARTSGQLEYFKSKTVEEGFPSSLVQRVFRTLCGSLLHGQRLHMLCRQFNTRGISKSYDIPVLYAVDISPVTLQMASS